MAFEITGGWSEFAAGDEGVLHEGNVHTPRAGVSKEVLTPSPNPKVPLMHPIFHFLLLTVCSLSLLSPPVQAEAGKAELHDWLLYGAFPGIGGLGSNGHHLENRLRPSPGDTERLQSQDNKYSASWKRYHSPGEWVDLDAEDTFRKRPNFAYPRGCAYASVYVRAPEATAARLEVSASIGYPMVWWGEVGARRSPSPDGATGQADFFLKMNAVAFADPNVEVIAWCDPKADQADDFALMHKGRGASPAVCAANVAAHYLDGRRPRILRQDTVQAARFSGTDDEVLAVWSKKPQKLAIAVEGNKAERIDVIGRRTSLAVVDGVCYVEAGPVIELVRAKAIAIRCK